MINRTFLEWFDNAMGIFTNGVHLKKTASEAAYHAKSTGFSPTAESENYHDIYTLWSRTHPFFNKLRKWYNTGRKRLPQSLELTPIITKLWYVSDGYLDVWRWGRPRIEIKARSEKNNAPFLLSLFQDIGFDPVYKRHEVRFTCDDTERVISWMGPSPPGFECKWELESRERYRRLKAKAYSKHATQTFD